MPLLECERTDAVVDAVSRARFVFLSAAMELLGGVRDYETTMASIAQLAVPRFADWASVHVLQEDGPRRVAVAHHDPAKSALAEELLEHYEIDLAGPDGAPAAVRTGAPRLVEEIDEHFLAEHVGNERQREIYRLLGSTSGIAAPLIVGDEVIGVLTFLLGDSGRRYHSDDVVLAQELARLCAVAVDNAERRRVADDALAAVRERARRLEVVAELGRTALASSDTDAILQKAIDTVAATLSVSHVAMVELSPDGESFRTVTGCGWDDEVYRAEVPSGTRSQAGYTLASDQPVIVRDMATETRFEIPKPLRDHNIVSSATVIVRSPEAPIGVVGAYSDSPREFTDDDVVFLSTIANIVGTAVARSQNDQALREARRLAEEARERLAFLAAASAALTESLDFATTMEKVAYLAVPHLADWCAVEVRFEDDDPERVVAHVDPDKVAIARQLQDRYPPDPYAAAGVPLTIRTGQPQLFSDVSEADLLATARDEEHRDILSSLGLRSAMIVPLVARDRVIGAVTLVAAESGRRFDDSDLALAEELASRAAVAIDNARLYEDHEQIARTLQASLLPPTDPEIPGLEMATAYRAAGRGIRIGGDFFDVFETSEGWALAIGDVCGKGTEAASITGLARHALRAAALRDADPGRLLGVVNEALLGQIPNDRFCTLVTAIFRVEDEATRVTVACGGHPYPMVLRADGTVETVLAHGPLLGVLPRVDIDNVEVRLGVGDLIVFFTDGVVDARADGVLFGENRLQDLLVSLVGDTAEGAAQRIEDAVVSFQHGVPGDDLALIAVRVPARG